MADIFDTTHMAFIPIVLCHCKSTKPKNHTRMHSIYYLLLHNTIPCAHKINRMRGRPILFHLLIWLFYLLYCNMISLRSTKITLQRQHFCLLLTFCKIEFCFTLRSSGAAKTGPAGLVPTPLCVLCSYSSCHHIDYKYNVHSNYSYTKICHCSQQKFFKYLHVFLSIL